MMKHEVMWDALGFGRRCDSYSSLSPEQLFRQAEQSKIREYADRIRNVEHADFSPLVFTTTGVMSPRCKIIFKKIAEKIAQLKELSYSVVCGWMRCRFSFALLRTTLICLRGTRKRKEKQGKPQIERAVVEARMNYWHATRLLLHFFIWLCLFRLQMTKRSD